MSDNLLNIREAAQYLGISEKRIKELVDKGELPAYKIGGSFLRFKKSQMGVLKAALYKRPRKNDAAPPRIEAAPARAEAIKDFLYFNDFYILSVIVIIIAVVLMIAT